MHPRKIAAFIQDERDTMLPGGIRGLGARR